MRLFVNLCWWRPRCVGCGDRFPMFRDGLCFDCALKESEARVWRSIGEACAIAIPIIVESFTRRRSRRNPSGAVRLRSRHRRKLDAELRDLRKIAGLPEIPPAEPAKPGEDTEANQA